MLDTRRFARQGTKLVLLLTALMHFAGIPLLTHEAGGSWSAGSVVHAAGECPDGDPAHSERACRTFQTPAPDAVLGRAAGLLTAAVLGASSVAAATQSARSLERSSIQARAPPAS